MPDVCQRITKSVSYAIKNFPVTAILGARQVGKTTLMEMLANKKSKKIKIYDLERQSDFDLIEEDPDFFLSNQKTPIFIDEAQLSKKLFNAIRVFVDKNRKKNGQIIISGSSSPELSKNISETLAGRIGIVELSTFELSEIEERKISPFYSVLKEGKIEKLKKLPIRERSWYESVWWGGYPEPLVKHSRKFRNIWSENYLRTYIDRDIRKLFPDLQIEHYRRFIKMLAFSSGEIINFAQWASALGVSEPTVKKYLEIAEGTFLFRKWPAFSHHEAKRLIKSPKGAIRDTGLISSLLKIEEPRDLLAHPRAGFLFEIFCIEQIIKGLQSQMISFDFSFYQTKNQAEIDLVLEFSKHIIPIEIKLGEKIRKESLYAIKEFATSKNSPFGIIINNSDAILEIAPRIYQIPFGAL